MVDAAFRSPASPNEKSRIGRRAQERQGNNRAVSSNVSGLYSIVVVARDTQPQWLHFLVY